MCIIIIIIIIQYSYEPDGKESKAFRTSNSNIASAEANEGWAHVFYHQGRIKH